MPTVRQLEKELRETREELRVANRNARDARDEASDLREIRNQMREEIATLKAELEQAGARGALVREFIQAQVHSTRIMCRVFGINPAE